MTTYPLIYVSKKDLKRTGISLDIFPNAGPNPNVTGMRRKFYGDAPLVKNGAYVYKVTPEIYKILKG